MYKNILVPVDLQELKTTQKAIDVAISEARRSGARLHMLSIVPGSSTALVATFFPSGALKEAKQKLARQFKDYVAKSVPDDIKVTPKVMEGHPPERIVEYAGKAGIDLIVMPARKRARPKLGMGYCSTKVVETAPCHVLVTR